jgi:hypothetical protein
VELACDDPDEHGELDVEDFAATVDARIAALKVEAAGWPATTNCDRLDQAFEALNEGGVLALQDAGATRSAG